MLVRVEVKLKWHSSSSKYLIRCRRFLSSHRFALCQTLAASYLEFCKYLRDVLVVLRTGFLVSMYGVPALWHTLPLR